MAVLIEAHSVIVRVDSILARYPGEWAGSVGDCPNGTHCMDGYVARVGFMHTDDVGAIVARLLTRGLRYFEDGRAHDVVVVDQQCGPMVRCDWLEVGRATKGKCRVTACRLKGTETELEIPEGWDYEGSFSQTFIFTPLGAMDKAMTFLRHEGGADVYLSRLTGDEVYMARANVDT